MRNKGNPGRFGALPFDPKVARRAALVRGIAPYNLIESVDCSYFASLCRLLQRSRGLLETGVADAINRAAILVDLKGHHSLRAIPFWKHGLLFALEQDAKAAARKRP